jgi:hypothetical protein
LTKLGVGVNGGGFGSLAAEALLAFFTGVMGTLNSGAVSSPLTAIASFDGLDFLDLFGGVSEVAERFLVVLATFEGVSEPGTAATEAILLDLRIVILKKPRLSIRRCGRCCSLCVLGSQRAAAQVDVS